MYEYFVLYFRLYDGTWIGVKDSAYYSGNFISMDGETVTYLPWLYGTNRYSGNCVGLYTTTGSGPYKYFSIRCEKTKQSLCYKNYGMPTH